MTTDLCESHKTYEQHIKECESSPKCSWFAIICPWGVTAKWDPKGYLAPAERGEK